MSRREVRTPPLGGRGNPCACLIAFVAYAMKPGHNKAAIETLPQGFKDLGLDALMSSIPPPLSWP
jgi:hypothetical protein